MRLFIVVLGCLIAVGFLTWVTLTLQKIQTHRDEMKRVQQITHSSGTNTP